MQTGCAIKTQLANCWTAQKIFQTQYSQNWTPVTSPSNFDSSYNSHLFVFILVMSTKRHSNRKTLSENITQSLIIIIIIIIIMKFLMTLPCFWIQKSTVLICAVVQFGRERYFQWTCCYCRQGCRVTVHSEVTVHTEVGDSACLRKAGILFYVRTS